MTSTSTSANGDAADADRAAWRAAVNHEDEHHHLTTLEGWRQFVTDAPASLQLLPTGQRERLERADRLKDEEARLDYHTRLRVVATSTLRHVVHTGRRLILLNRHAISARRGLIVSGAAGTGKTTAITQFGKTHESSTASATRTVPTGSRWSTSPSHPQRRPGCWRWSSPASWGCR